MNILFNLIIAIILVISSPFLVEPKIYDIVNAQTVEDEVIENTLEAVEEATQGTEEVLKSVNNASEVSTRDQYEGSTTLEEQLKLAQEKLNQIGLGSSNISKLKIDLGFPPVDFVKMLEDTVGSFIDVEYQSASFVVLRGDEEILLLLNGTLAPFWYAIDIVKKYGYQLKEITETGMGSQGNPTRFYAILKK